MTSKFLQRTFNTASGNNGSDKNSLAKVQQLNDSLHCTLVNEREDLVHFAEIADRMRQNTKNAELIRDRVKVLRDHVEECVESMNDASQRSAELQSEFNKLGIDLQFSSQGDIVAPTPDGFQSRRKSTLLNGDRLKIVHELNHQQIKAKLLKILEPTGAKAADSDKVESVWNQQYLDSSSSLPQDIDASFRSLDIADRAEIEDVELLLYLVKISEKFQMILGERLNAMSKTMEESVSDEWNRLIKGTVRQSRYEGREFFSKLSAYHDSMKNLNTNLNRASSSAGDDVMVASTEYVPEIVTDENAESQQGAGSAMSKSIKSLFLARSQQPKTFDIKRYMQLKDAFEESKEQLIAKTETSARKFEESEMEWETGVFPQKLLLYLKEMRAFFQSGLDACNELLPPEMADMFEKAMKKRHISRKINLEQTSAEIHDLFKKEPIMKSPPPIPTLPPKPRPFTGNLESKLSRHPPPPVPADKPKTISPPEFAPPPPPKPFNVNLSTSVPPTPPISPNGLTQTSQITKRIRLVKIPQGFGSDSSELIAKIIDPNAEFLCNSLLKADKHLPEPSVVSQTSPSSPFDAVKRSIQLVAEAGLLNDWTCVIFERWRDEIFSPRFKEFCEGQDGFSTSASVKKAEFVHNLHLHLMWAHGKHYLQKCINELHDFFTNASSEHTFIEDIDWLEFLRKIWRILLGHRGLITSNMKQVLSHTFTESGFTDCEDSIELHRFVSLILFHQMVLPAISNMPELIAYWKSNPHSCILTKKASSPPPPKIELPALYQDLVSRVDYLLRVTLGYSLEIPITSSGNEMIDIGLEPVGHQMSIELKAPLEDFFANVTKPNNRVTIHQEAPDYWMIETRCQEWCTLYNPSI